VVLLFISIVIVRSDVLEYVNQNLRAAPQAVAGKPKAAKGRIDAPGPRKRIQGRPTRAWGRPGWRKKVNGEVVRV